MSGLIERTCLILKGMSETDVWTSRQDGTPMEPPDEMAPGANKPE
jgi:hypothetical protein